LAQERAASVDANPAEGSVSVSANESGSVLTLSGNFQLLHARPLQEAALQLAETRGNVVVDCSGVTHLDACAVQVLLALKFALERGGRSLGLLGASEDVRNYLGWAGVTAHFASRESGEAAPRKRRRTPRKRSV